MLKNIEFLEKILFVQSGLGFCHMKLWKKSIIGDIRFNEELKVGEDALFNINVSKNAEKFYMLNMPLYNYRFNEMSAVRRYDDKYADKYLQSMKVTQKYINQYYNDNENILKKINNYVAYHVLLIIINYCMNPRNNLNFINQLKLINKICQIEEFKNAIKLSDYDGFSITRKVTLFTLKHELYFFTTIIGKIRQMQFKNRK